MIKALARTEIENTIFMPHFVRCGCDNASCHRYVKRRKSSTDKSNIATRDIRLSNFPADDCYTSLMVNPRSYIPANLSRNKMDNVNVARRVSPPSASADILYIYFFFLPSNGESVASSNKIVDGKRRRK